MNLSHHIPDDSFARELQGFGPAGIVSMLLILLTGNIMLPGMIVVPIGAMLVLLWVRLSGTSWDQIGYVRPANWLIIIITGILFGVAFKLLMKSVVMPLLGADPINQSYHFLAGNESLLPAAIWAMLVAGFAEETVFRGYLFERLGNLFGQTKNKRWMILVITSALFAFSHYFNQGWAGVEQAAITGLAFGTIYLFTKSIWMIMIAHAVFDLTALVLIYWNLETDVAHLVFK